jgi:hypothetical protein
MTDDASDVHGEASEDGVFRGRWIEKDGGRIWEGPYSRDEARGPAVVIYIFDRPRQVTGCLLPDGTRGSARATMMDHYASSGTAGWRRPLPDGSWRHGRLEILEQDVRFIDVLIDAEPRERKKTNRPDLEGDLLADARIRALALDDGYAEELYGAMCNMDWVTHDGANADEPWSCSWRYSGGIVADLRERGEEYTDFYCSGGEGTVTDRVRVEMARLGWSPVGEEIASINEIDVLPAGPLLRFGAESEPEDGLDGGDGPAG